MFNQLVQKLNFFCNYKANDITIKVGIEILAFFEKHLRVELIQTSAFQDIVNCVIKCLDVKTKKKKNKLQQI